MGTVFRSESLGKRIAATRKQTGMSQRQLAKEVGVTAAAISQFENSSRNPSDGTLRTLAKVLQVPVESLRRPGEESEASIHGNRREKRAPGSNNGRPLSPEKTPSDRIREQNDSLYRELITIIYELPIQSMPLAIRLLRAIGEPDQEDGPPKAG